MPQAKGESTVVGRFDWFEKQFGIKPVWPVTIAVLGIVVGWLASGARDRPEVQAVAQHAFGVAVPPIQPESSDAVKSIATIENHFEHGVDGWTKAQGARAGNTFTTENAAVLSFNVVDGSKAMAIASPTTSEADADLGVVLAYVSQLGRSAEESAENYQRISAWLEQPSETLKLHGSLLTYTVDDDVRFVRVFAAP